MIDFGYTSAEKPKLNISYDVENLEEILKKGEQKTEQATLFLIIEKWRKIKNWLNELPMIILSK